jgi:hypothetical protein
MTRIITPKRYGAGVLGDMEYQSASGLWVPGRGTPAPGKALVVAGDGIPEWTDIATQAELDAAVLAVSGSAVALISEHIVPVGGEASVTFLSIPNTYRDLRIVVRGRGSKAAAITTLFMRVNNDSSAIYDYAKVEFGNTTAFSSGSVAQTSWHIGYLNAASSPAGVASAAEVQILDYRGTTFHKTMFAAGGANNATGAPAAANLFVDRFTGWYRSTTAIARVDVFPDSGNFNQDTIVSLYGSL